MQLIKEMDDYEQLSSQQKAAVLDSLVYAGELFTEENLPFLLEAISQHAVVEKAKVTSKKPLVKKGKPLAAKVDIFDFVTFKKEYAALACLYSGLELHLRTALLLDYKYNYLAKEDRHILNLVVSKKTGKPLLAYTNPEGKLVGKPVTKKYMNNFTNVLEPYYIFKKWYQHYNPSKLDDKKFLKDTLEKYQGHEDVALNKMYRL